ncbi:MAG TPA: PQQ-dependent sugar dehydrogenase [Puia sp.]|jgi:glucose/arabinose dehydrogenase|nr:PQQ-dependent sugar dehydrogenase [Puia sp.]
MKKIRDTLFVAILLLSTLCRGADISNPIIGDTNRIFKLATPKSDVSLTIPNGFTANVFAAGLGKARHITVTPSGYIYVKLASSKNGNTIVRLKDQNSDGIADEEMDFGSFKGTGIKVKNGWLYASSDEEVYRFKLNSDGTVANPDRPEKIITGLISRGEHEAKAFTLDNSGNIYVNIGAYSNSCQIEDRKVASMGRKPCPILDSAGGIWQFKADKLNQTYAEGIRYATGLRNVVGLDWNAATNSLFVMQHGRDQLHTIFPAMFTDKQNAELPAECMYELHKGSNAGWPYIYYDQIQGKKILAPEYGGDGKKTAGEDAINPVYAFPGHLAPNGLLFYTGNQFPAKYRNGAFIAFHGSWNRAPEPQEGFYVVFVPFSNGKPSGKWEIFANGFSGGPKNTASGGALHRPCGLAEGPDGALYVTDDVQGTIWRITYK